MIKGSCCCKAVQFELANAPSFVGTCHCSRCRKVGASTIAFVKKEDLGWIDLKRYSNKFGLDRASDSRKAGQTIFHEAIRKRTPVIEKRYRTAFEKSYENLFSWRNQYAHQRAAVATLDEVYNSHRVAKHVIIEFARSFEH